MNMDFEQQRREDGVTKVLFVIEEIQSVPNIAEIPHVNLGRGRGMFTDQNDWSVKPVQDAVGGYPAAIIQKHCRSDAENIERQTDRHAPGYFRNPTRDFCFVQRWLHEGRVA